MDKKRKEERGKELLQSAEYIVKRNGDCGDLLCEECFIRNVGNLCPKNDIKRLILAKKFIKAGTVSKYSQIEVKNLLGIGEPISLQERLLKFFRRKEKRD